MPLDQIRSKLVSIGYRIEDIEFTIIEILQYKNPNFLDATDFNIMIGLLKKREGAFAPS